MPTHQNDKLLYNVALSLIPKLGPNIFKNIISYCGSAQAFFSITQGKAARIPGIGPKLLEYRKNQDTYLRAADLTIGEAIKNNINIHTYLDKSYPERLKALPDSPTVLFSKGNVDLNPCRSLGIVGTRNATTYGKNITQKIVEELAPYHPTIVSGLAYGIDIEAHRAALTHQIPTIGILGSDLNHIYPALHKKTAEQMMEKGGLLTEFKLGSALNPGNFPQRNRIIAGLSDAIIIVEAAKKGGALITAEIGYSYNKEVFAVPGNLQSNFSEGCNNLIRSMKAGIYMGSKEVIEALSWDKDGESKQTSSQILETDQLDDIEKKILRLLSEKSEMELDRLSWEMEIPLSAIAVKLLNLEFLGFIKSLPGKKYRWDHRG